MRACVYACVCVCAGIYMSFGEVVEKAPSHFRSPIRIFFVPRFWALAHFLSTESAFKRLFCPCTTHFATFTTWETIWSRSVKSPNSWWNDVQKSTLQTDLDKPKLSIPHSCKFLLPLAANLLPNWSKQEGIWCQWQQKFGGVQKTGQNSREFAASSFAWVRYAKSLVIGFHSCKRHSAR